MKRPHHPISTVAVLLTLTLAISGCSRTGGRAAEERRRQSAQAEADSIEHTIAFITHEAPGDTFWTVVRAGAEEAAARHHVRLVYANSPEGLRQANLVQNAVDSQVDGIAATLAKPEAMRRALEQAVNAGIAVVGVNSGLEHWHDLGAVMFFGQDERLAGEAAGERLNAEGVGHVLCVIQEQGQVSLEARCDGVGSTFEGTAEKLYVEGTNMPSVRSTISAKLIQNRGIERVLMLGAPFALTAVQAVNDSGSDRARVVTFDLNGELVEAIENGDVLWAVDQQPYLQGYLAVVGLWVYLTNGNTIGGDQAVLTGPNFVTNANIDDMTEYALRGTR